MDSILLIITIVLLICFFVFVHTINVQNFNITTNPSRNLYLYDNSNIPILNPPKEIVIDENKLSCHRELTPCNSNEDCQLCAETLASCHEFHDTVVLELFGDDNKEVVITPGQKLCLALDNKSARSCNPNTGTWVIRQVDDNDNFALVCHCDRPGLVTQLNVYDDCTFPVGCKPHGVIANINATPLVCDCEAGYVAEISETNTPYCRPRVMRDVMLDPQFFARPPCHDGFLQAEHPAFDPTYRRQIGANVCLPDPCSVDPVTGVVTSGRLLYDQQGGFDGKGLVMCQCSALDGLFPIYSPVSMLLTRYNENDPVVPNYCLKPILDNPSTDNIRRDLKVFWGRNSLKSDADIVLQVNMEDVYPNYHPIMYPNLTGHTAGGMIDTRFFLKFEINSVFVPSAWHNYMYDVYQGYWRFSFYERNWIDINDPWVNSCPNTAYGQCSGHDDGIDFFRCIPNYRIQIAFRSTCYQYLQERQYGGGVGTMHQICVYQRPELYEDPASVPVAFLVDIRAVQVTKPPPDHRTRSVYVVNAYRAVRQDQYQNLIQTLNTFEHYSSV
ncbi:pif-1 [Cnaphalocrocis medinalis granulovirus]|uniref:Pif-1 n=1 Tax=Cnaphalocrocis medinalis granulovirus TaxID=1750712 RepID=A0A109WW59_9BBAC|nr:pif-1 [Cnaphalocrocis medinalis granulovirus]AMF83806.1 pif-1 [Cnaphalocrocis medinalis granulovirus]